MEQNSASSTVITVVGHTEKDGVQHNGNYSTPNSDEHRHKCAFCPKTYLTKFGLSRHKRRVHDKVTEHIACRHCGRTCSKAYIRTHERLCKTNLQLKKKRPSCTHPDCLQTFYRKEDVIEHLKRDHGENIEDPIVKWFPSFEEFMQWKEEEELRTYSYYTKQGGKLKDPSKCYFCQHDGHPNPHRKNHENIIAKKRNSKGRIKKGGVCMSFMRMRKKEGGAVEVYYWPTHSHPLSPSDLKHQRLSDSTYRFIEDQIKKNVPIRQIHADLKRRAVDEKGQVLTRESFVTLKRIASMASRLRKGEHSSDNDSLEKYVEALNMVEDSPIILYSVREGEGDTEEMGTDFVLGLQTRDQQEILQREYVTPMFAGISFEGDEYGSCVLSLLVPTEENGEYPVGHLITNKMDEEIIALFFRTIAERCPNLNIGCIISEDNPVLLTAMKEVFGEGAIFISKWHILEEFREHMLKTTSVELIEEMKFILTAMVEASTEEDFISLSDDFQMKYGITAPDFCSYLSEYLAKASSWAMCYRQYPDTVDSSLYVDCFRHKLSRGYKKRPAKKIILLPELLLQMQEEYKCLREKMLIGDFDVSQAQVHHVKSQEVSEKYVHPTSTNHWTVATRDQSYHIMQCAQVCSNEECLVRCLSCDRLCSHMYFCTCVNGQQLCKHIHKIHSMLSNPEDDDDNADPLEAMYVSEGASPKIEAMDSALEDDEHMEDIVLENKSNDEDLKSEVLVLTETIKHEVETGNLPPHALEEIKLKLKELVDTCKTVIDDHTKIIKIKPTEEASAVVVISTTSFTDT